MNLREISFPLNVYAAMLLWSGVPLDHLHYGLYAHADEPTGVAQQRASEALWAQMPPPCRVLDVGCGFGNHLRQLAARGYAAQGITPDAAQAAIARQGHGPAIDVQVLRLEDLPTPQQPWDLMLLHDSAQYIQPLDLFSCADRLLADAATMLLMDEFALDRRGPEHFGLHDFKAFVALAGRFGWQVEHSQDLSARAAHTLHAIESMLLQQRQRLLAELAVSNEQIENLVLSARRYRRLYAEGVYGYRLLRLRRTSRPARTLGRVGQAQSAAMRELFARSFGHSLDADEWDWKYGSGRGHAVGLWQGQQLAAHYGALSRPALLMGQQAMACQVGDVMVASEINAGLGRKGPFYEVCATALEAEIGWGQGHAVGFGFPNARAMRVAERLGLYAAADIVEALSWTADAAALLALPGACTAELVDLAQLREGTQLWDVLLALWHEMAASLPDAALGVRDPAWLRHRYGRRPHVRYPAALLRREAGGICIGLVVLRVHEQVLELVDLLGAREHWPALIRLARQQAHAEGRSRVETWITASHRSAIDDPACPADILALDVVVPANVHSPGMPLEQLRGRWFLMSGDTDFR